MKIVNLARRPFRNQRPVLRAAIGLWMLGALLVLANLWLWGDYLQGSSTSEGKLAALERQIDEEEKHLDTYGQRLRNLKLATRNQQASYLNLQIHRRTFPWSALFDQLEDVLPLDVYLEDVKPEVERADDRSARSTRRRSAPRLSAREARRRARERAAGGESEPQPQAAAEPEVKEDTRDRVNLALNGYARTEDDMFDLVDRLYQHPSFLDPNLSRESRESVNEKIAFSIRVVYLMPSHELPQTMVADVSTETLGVEEGSALPASTATTPEDLKQRLGGSDAQQGDALPETASRSPEGSTIQRESAATASRVAVAPRPSRNEASSRSTTSAPGSEPPNPRAIAGRGRTDRPPRGQERTSRGGTQRGSTARERRDLTRQAIEDRRQKAREAAAQRRGLTTSQDEPTSRTPPTASGTPRVLGWHRGIEDFVPRFLQPALGIPEDSPVWQEEGA